MTGDEYSSDYERQKAEKKEKREKANALLRKYWNGEISYEEYQDEIKKQAAKAAETTPKTLIKSSFAITGPRVHGPLGQAGIFGYNTDPPAFLPTGNPDDSHYFQE